MTYTVSILRRAQKELQRLPAEDYERVREAMRALAHNPRPAGCLALTGRAGWRIRVGDYRVIYEIRRSSATTLIMNGLEFGGQELSKRPDMIGQSSGHAGGLVAPLGLDQS
jgi:mRNA interferase RelE/StbE